MNDEKRKVFEKAKKIPNKNPKIYRKDPYDKTIYLYSYGKNSEMGWEIDHIKPLQKGGSDNIRNKQALNTHINRSKQDTLVKKSRHNQK